VHDSAGACLRSTVTKESHQILSGRLALQAHSPSTPPTRMECFERRHCAHSCKKARLPQSAETLTLVARDAWSFKASRSSSARKGFDQDIDTVRGNRVYRLRSGVDRHHNGRYVPAKGGTEVPDGLDTIR
jgi:hypothetical protein